MMCADHPPDSLIARDLHSRGIAVGRLIPLWQEKSAAVVAYDPEKFEYVRIIFDNGVESLGCTYSEFISNVLVQLIDSGLWDEILGLAELFHYPHPERLLKIAEAAEDDRFNRDFARFLDDVR